MAFPFGNVWDCRAYERTGHCRYHCTEMRQGAVQGEKRLVLTPGNYGTDFLKSGAICISDGIPHVKCSNFVGESLDLAKLEGFEEILLVGHIGKFVKLAGGIMNTPLQMGRWTGGAVLRPCSPCVVHLSRRQRH